MLVDGILRWMRLLYSDQLDLPKEVVCEQGFSLFAVDLAGQGHHAEIQYRIPPQPAS